MILTLEELADKISVGLPDWQRDANLQFLRSLHTSLKEDGVWMSPALGSIYTKAGDGFKLVADERTTIMMGEPNNVSH